MDTCLPPASAASDCWQDLLFHHAPDGMAVVQAGDIVRCNPAWRRWCLLDAAQPATLAASVHPDDISPLLDFCLGACAPAESASRLLLRCATPGEDGAFGWLEATAAGLEWEGHPAVVVCIRPVQEADGQQDQPLQALAEARQALHLSEQRYLELFERAPVGVFVTESSGRALHLNPFMARMVGAGSAEEALEHYQELPRQLYVHPERRQEALQRLAREGAVANFELQARRVDGEVIWISMNARMRERQADGCFLIDGFALDVTDRKRAEQALAESESRYRALFEDNAMVMALVDPETGAFLDVNKAACAFYGWPRDKFLTMHAADINLASRRTLQREMAAALCGGKRYFTFRHRLASGEVRDVEVYSGPIVVRGKAFLYTCVFDITERVQAEHALRKSQQHLRHIADTVPGVLYQFKRDPDGNYSFPYVSDRARDLMDLHPMDIMRDAQTLYARIHADDMAAIMEKSERSAALLEPFSLAYRFYCADGRERWFKADSIPARQEDGSTLWSGIVIDITDRVPAEQGNGQEN